MVTVIKEETEIEFPAELNRQLLCLFKDTCNAAIVFNMSGEIIAWNKFAEQLYGWTEADLLGKSITILEAENDPFETTGIVEKIMAGVLLEPVKTRRLTKDGALLDIELTIKKLENSLGDVIAIASIERETPRQSFAEEIWKRYRELIESINQGLYSVDKEGIFTFVSPLVEIITGYSFSEMIGRPYTDFVPIEEIPRLRALTTEILSGNAASFEYRIIKRTGELRWVHTSLKAVIKDQQVVEINGVFSDINDRKLAEEALRESEEKFKMIFENANDEIIYVDMNGTIIDVNSKMEDIFGYKREEVIGKNFSGFDYFTAETMQKAVELFEAAVSGGPAPMMEFEICRKDKKAVTIEVNSKVLTKQGVINGMLLIIRDITERKRTEAALMERERLLRQITDNMTDVVAMIDMNGILKYISSSVTKAIGFLPEEMVGTSIYDHLHEDDLDIREKIMRNEDSKPSSVSRRFRCRHSDGRYLWFEARGDCVRDNSDQIIGIVFGSRDITEQKMAEEEIQKTNLALEKSIKDLKDAQSYIIQNEKMAALGRLVAGVAHEINTPLGIGITASSFLNDQVDLYSGKFISDKMEKSDFKQFVNKVSEASSIIYSNLVRAADLVSSFKLVAVDQSDENAHKFNLKEYFKSVVNSLRPELNKSGHKVDIQCGEDLFIESYPGCFSQILANLIMNSLTHGFTGITRGNITIDASITEFQELFLFYSDDGRGMSKDVLSKIFEPFFTTNRSRGSTGLGLHIVYNLVTQRLNGHIECVSDFNSGAHFFIKIPLMK